MSPEIESTTLTPGLAIWHRYDPKVKADLFSTRLRHASGVYLIDPIRLPSTNEDLFRRGECTGIIVTNSNHVRAAGEMACLLKVPVFAHPKAGAEMAGADLRVLDDGQMLAPGLQVATIEGAPLGEVALHCDDEGGTLILGDALINMGSAGFAFLPSKYCTDQKLMRRSLRKLLQFRFARMLFAHGTPIAVRAEERLAALLS